VSAYARANGDREWRFSLRRSRRLATKVLNDLFTLSIRKFLRYFFKVRLQTDPLGFPSQGKLATKEPDELNLTMFL
jgi:hypothetical protein